MLNQVILVGRLTRDLEVHESDKGKKVATCTIAVPRAFKNKDGILETDFINCTLWDAIALNTSEYCKKGDIVGIKGRLQTKKETVDDKTYYRLELVADKVSFLSGH